MICLMHEGNPYGHLKVGSKVVLPAILARVVGADLADVDAWLFELIEAGVCSIGDDGCYLSRRMVRDEEIRQVRASGGKKSLEHPNVPQPKGTNKDTLEGSPSPPSLGGSPSSSSSSSSAKKDQKQKIRAARSANFTAKDLIDQYGVDKQVAEDFLETRKVKRLANTGTAMKGLIREFTLANLLVADGIRLCTEKGWGGFNHKWPTDGGSNGTGNQGSSPGPMSAPDRVRAAIAARETGSAEGGRTLEHQ